MSTSNDSIYGFAPLDEYSLKDRIVIRLIELSCYLIMRLIGMTIRFEIEGWENYESVIEAGKAPIWPFWHERIFLSTIYFRNRGILVITSKSKDGEYIARLIQRFGFGAIRGSSSRGGSKALIEMKRQMVMGREIAFTVDGPRGPRHKAKPGPVFLAKLTGNPVLPVSFEASSCWTLSTWDMLQIPKPFSRAKLFIDPPFYVDGSADEPEINAKVEAMQHSLDGLVERGRSWSGLVRSGRKKARNKQNVRDPNRIR